MSIAYTDFRSALRMRESSGNYLVVNPYGYLGAYQFGEGALIDLGYVRNDGYWQDNDFSGGWTGLDGIDSTDEFLQTPAAQDRAADAWFELMWSYLVGVGANAWLGQRVAGITLTASGLIGGAHLLGQHVVLDWLQSGGSADPVDQMGTHVSEYIGLFNGYVMPFDTGEPDLVALGALLDTLPDGLRDGVEARYDAAGRLLAAADDSATALDGSDEKEVLLGLGGDDRLTGYSGADALLGQDGDDVILAGDGFDLAVGGAGQDEIYGRRDGDRLVGGPGDDLLAGNGGNDRLVGNTGHDILRGGPGDDTLLGGYGRDDLRGQDGNDVLDGGPGADLLVGGDGADLFVFADGDGKDRIRDFDGAEGDRIDLSGLAAITDYDDLVRHHALQDGDDVVISVDADTQLILKNIALGDLGADDFLFV